MNNDELQRAIDDITKDNAPAEAAPAVGSVAENEQLANELDQTVAPATANTPETPDFGVAPAPAIPDAPGMPPVEMSEVAAPVVEAPAAPAAPVAEAAEPVAEAAPAADNDTLNEALKELYPLLDKVDIPVGEKFDITMKFGTPAKALDIAKQMTDETAKANALLEIVNKLK